MLKTYNRLVELIKTKPRSEVAMQEARQMKAFIQENSMCYNCHIPCKFEESDFRFNGVCKECGAKYSKMIATKSKILMNQPVGVLALTRYKANLTKMHYIPASLRGSGTLDELVEALDNYIIEVARR